MPQLREGTHLLHIGPPKTGSSAIQAALRRERATLKDHGWDYSATRLGIFAGLGFLAPAGGPRPDLASWNDLRRRLAEDAGQRFCFSEEKFARATDAQRAQVIQELGGDHPHVVAVARRYDLLLPSQWQQQVKARSRISYPDWLHETLPRHDKGPLRGPFWDTHETIRMVERWTRLVGAENFTLIIADEADRGLLSRTFESLMGLPEGTLRTEEGGWTTNRSFSFPEIELVRSANIAFRDNRWSDGDHYALIRRGLIREFRRSSFPDAEPRIPDLPDWALERVSTINEQRIEQLPALGINVIGDPESLRVMPKPSAPGAIDSAVVSMQTAARAMEGVARGAVSARRKDRIANRRRIRTLRRKLGRARPSRGLGRRILRRIRSTYSR